MVIWTIVGGFQFSNTTRGTTELRAPGLFEHPLHNPEPHFNCPLCIRFLYPLISPHAGFGGWVKTLVPWFSPQESCSVDINHLQKGTRGFVGPPSIVASETLQGGWKCNVFLLTECWRGPTYNKVVCLPCPWTRSALYFIAENSPNPWQMMKARARIRLYAYQSKAM